MPRFMHYNYDQDAMVVINYQEQLQPGTFEHAVHYLIEHKLDLSVFHPKYRNDDTGRIAYDPAILLKIILFAYSKGITSSREIQWCCETNIIFKALSCDTVPHFTTLAKFVSSHAEEIEELFEQVLLVCHEQGLLGNELFAIDGCKMSSNAAKEWSGTFKELGEKRDKLKRLIRHHLREHHQRDEAETEAELDRDIRRAKTILSLDEAMTKVDRFLKTSSPRMGQGKRHQNLPKTGWKTIIPASEFQFDPVNLSCICPAGQELHYEATRTDGNGVSRAHFKGRLLQCRNCPKKRQCMQNPASADHRKGSGRQVTFALERNRGPTYTDWMKHRVDSPQGKEIYSRCMSVLEPVFGNIGTTKRLNCFSLRGKRKVQGQRQLYCLVHNIEKLANYGQMAA
ncbi:transposase [Marinobacter litoralis]|uniref:transposase n=1 Tax=Marinobacter litoralis TaxID=187981 RepID=UPI0018EDDDD9|nr:transposase [Marinobacter litoralis]MBJ6138589.1 transposase [Marinobacter litoralis]